MTVQENFTNWLVDLRQFDYFVTLNFNRTASKTKIRNSFKTWLAFIDRIYLGHDWFKKPSAERTFAVATVEGEENVHLHILLKLPGEMREDKLRELWLKIMRSGTCDIRSISDLPRVVKYTGKQLFRNERVEDFLISTEFHNYVSKKNLSNA